MQYNNYCLSYNVLYTAFLSYTNCIAILLPLCGPGVFGFGGLEWNGEIAQVRELRRIWSQTITI